MAGLVAKWGRLKKPSTPKVLKLPIGEFEICQRLREARDHLGLSRAQVADFLKVSKERIASYEDGRVGLPADFALRFCRFFGFGEQWLAIGPKFDWPSEGFEKRGNWPMPLLMRLCTSLLVDPIVHQLPPRILFSAAFKSTLQARYTEIVKGRLASPYLVELEGDPPEVLQLHVLAYVEVARCPLAPSLRDVIICDLIRRLDPSIPVEHISGIVKRLREGPTLGDFAQGNPMADLLEQMRKHTAERGKPAELAKYLKVSRSSVSDWLSGKSRPSAEAVLQILQWIKTQAVIPK